MGPHVDGSDRGYVVKLDVQTGTTTEYSKEHVYTAAPEFVPRPDAVVSEGRGRYPIEPWKKGSHGLQQRCYIEVLALGSLILSMTASVDNRLSII